MYRNLFDAMIESKLIVNNKYFKEYELLIENNIETSPVRFKTQQHHIIPVHFTKYYDFSKVEYETRINLDFKNHILAHYYLALCGAFDDIRFFNELAVLRMIGDSEVNIEDRKWIESLDKYSSIYEESCKINSEKHKGKPSWNLGKHYSVGPMKDERKSKIRESAKGRYSGDIWIHRDKENKHIKPSELEHYMLLGFELGRNDPECNRKNSESQRANPNRAMLGKHQSDYQKSVVSQKLTGVPKSDEARKNMSSARTGKVLVSNDTTNDTLYVAKTELDFYISKGYRKGRLNKRP